MRINQMAVSNHLYYHCWGLLRAIIIKNYHHSLLNHVFTLVLLLSSSCIVAKKTANAHSKLIQNAVQQQQKLIESYGLSSQTKWQEKCQQLLKEMALIEFKQCLVIKAPFVNAYSLAHGSVLLTAGLLEQINNDNQLAHILAHEHAHMSLNHHQQIQQLLQNPPKLFTKSRVKKFYRHLEQLADEAANELLIQQRRDPLQIHHYLLRIETNSKEHSSDHPKLKDRIQRTDLPCEVKEAFWTSE